MIKYVYIQNNTSKDMLAWASNQSSLLTYLEGCYNVSTAATICARQIELAEACLPMLQHPLGFGRAFLKVQKGRGEVRMDGMGCGEGRDKGAKTFYTAQKVLLGIMWSTQRDSWFLEAEIGFLTPSPACWGCISSWKVRDVLERFFEMLNILFQPQNLIYLKSS